MLLKFLQTKPQVKNMNFKFYDLNYTVIKNGKEKDFEEDQKEIVHNHYENDYIKFNDIVPNHYIGRKLDNVTSR